MIINVASKDFKRNGKHKLAFDGFRVIRDNWYFETYPRLKEFSDDCIIIDYNDPDPDSDLASDFDVIFLAKGSRPELSISSYKTSFSKDDRLSPLLVINTMIVISSSTLDELLRINDSDDNEEMASYMEFDSAYNITGCFDHFRVSAKYGEASYYSNNLKWHRLDPSLEKNSHLHIRSLPEDTLSEIATIITR